LTGARPFARESATAEATAHVYERVPPASARNPDLPRDVDLIFMTALAKDPSRRYPSCCAFVSVLDSACGLLDHATTRVIVPPASDRPTRVKRPRRRSPALTVGFGLMLLSGAALGGALAASVFRPSKPIAVGGATRTVTSTTTITSPPTTVTSPVSG